MKNQKKNLKNIIIPILLFGVASFALYYISNQIKEKGASVAELTKKTEAEINRRNKISALNLEVKAIAGDRALLETHFAESSNVVPYLDTLQDLAKKVFAPAEISSVELSEDGTNLIVEMSAEGSFVGVYKLLSLLENSPYEIRLDAVKLEQQTLSDAEAKLAIGPVWRANFIITLLSFNVK